VIAAVTGGRDHWPTLAELEALGHAVRARGIVTVRDGDCPTGVDRIARGYLLDRGVCQVEKWPAAWRELGKRAGMVRNASMLDGDRDALTGGRSLLDTQRADVLFAFRGGVGTAGCVREAESRGIEVVRIEPVAEPAIWNMHYRWSKAPATPPGLIYCGRSREHGGPSPLANPWPVELLPGETRAEAADRILGKYRRWLWSKIAAGDRAVLDVLDAIEPDAWLGCTCWPRRCHVEIIVRAWRWRRGMQTALPR
jgi:hypothetical protein